MCNCNFSFVIISLKLQCMNVFEFFNWPGKLPDHIYCRTFLLYLINIILKYFILMFCKDMHTIIMNLIHSLMYTNSKWY